MVLFRVSLASVTDNLPIELEIPSGPEESSTVELDI
jgi:hypothetical protein